LIVEYFLYGRGRPDRTTWTGSMHIVNLPDVEAARVFASATASSCAAPY
jgi:hypothetical protein